MSILKAVNSHSNIKNIISYVTKKEKTIGKKLCSVYNCCTIDTAAKEMQTTKELYNKTKGRTYLHFVQSFPPDENITPQQAHELAKEFVEQNPLFSDFEIVFTTHVDKNHIHSHIILNSVSFVDGHKFQMSKKDLEDMKILNNKLCLEHGFSICEIGKKKSDSMTLIAYDTNKYQFLKKAKEGKAVKSYVMDAAVTVYNSMQASTSKEEFIKSMENKGYSVDWQDNHKYIVFINAEGKKVRNSNLQKTYNLNVGKEELIALFKEKSLQKEHSTRHRKR